MMDIKITDQDGDVYSGQVMRIDRTELGIHEHYGIFTFNLTLRGKNTGVGFGGLTLDSNPQSSGQDRTATSYGMAVITKILRTVGVDHWEQLKGQDIVALFDQPGYSGTIVGIASLDGDRTMVLDKMSEEGARR